LDKYNKNNDEVWSSITTNEGSVSHLDFLTEEERETFKTAFEIDQRWIVELGADRTPHISQAQSVNVFIPADIHKKELHDIHFQAWKKGLKSLYYCRSKSIQRAENINSGSSTDVTKNVYSKSKNVEKESDNKTDYEECLSCQ
jgi:ribonucleoside-diphosphate reductase alpha chain